jgi:predicted kinase
MPVIMPCRARLRNVTSGIPDPALVVLVGASGSGKSTWAQQRYRSQEIVSSDELRGVVGSGRHDLDASDDAFRLLDGIVAARTRRGLTVVVDTLGLEPERRRGYRALAARTGMPAVAVVFDVAARLVRERNAARDRPVPAPVLRSQLARTAAVVDELAAEGWDHVVVVRADDAPMPVGVGTPAAAPARPTGSSSSCKFPGSRGGRSRPAG